MFVVVSIVSEYGDPPAHISDLTFAEQELDTNRSQTCSGDVYVSNASGCASRSLVATDARFATALGINGTTTCAVVRIHQGEQARGRQPRSARGRSSPQRRSSQRQTMTKVATCAHRACVQPEASRARANPRGSESEPARLTELALRDTTSMQAGESGVKLSSASTVTFFMPAADFTGSRAALVGL